MKINNFLVKKIIENKKNQYHKFRSPLRSNFVCYFKTFLTTIQEMIFPQHGVFTKGLIELKRAFKRKLFFGKQNGVKREKYFA